MTSAFESAPWWRRPIGLVAIVLLVIVGSWWAVEILDTLVFDELLQRNGIRPRKLNGLAGVLAAPFLHSDFGHLVSNTFPFLLLSALVLIRGVRYWLTVSMLGWLVGGFLTWLMAGGGNHVGASGVVFCYFGALLGAAVFERRAGAFAPALVTVMLYATMLVGLVPQQFISWEGHLSGFVVGVVTSKLLAQPRPQRNRADDEARIKAIYGDSEPWLDGAEDP